MTSDSKAPMTLWDRIERWRTKVCLDEGECSCHQDCADELEADLRELRAVALDIRKTAEGYPSDSAMRTHLLEHAAALEAKLGGQR